MTFAVPTNCYRQLPCGVEGKLDPNIGFIKRPLAKRKLQIYTFYNTLLKSNCLGPKNIIVLLPLTLSEVVKK